ncbi:transposase IS116/IS110/IS902 family protein [Salipiger aestuarii]|uniref:Transposase IS116/IS110/IS902 family protein n=1 Tax=Salipiger aestuarii TaxID=568098 RepID=A0A327YDD5_9RHOB|nr:transposase IS116/IS110/IS902 family protein [Salipiger aestuarii]
MVTSMLRGQAGLRSELARIELRLRRIARQDRICRLTMSTPGVGAVVALHVKAGIDDPARFRSSKMVGPHFGLTPRREQSGERDVVGAISGAGDRSVRTALFQAATVMLYHSHPKNWLKAWGTRVAQRRGIGRAVVAVARRLAVVLHRMWSDNAPFRLTRSTADGAAA